MILVNACIVAFLNLVLAVLIRRWEIVLSLTCTISLLWSIANHYVIAFHGSPLFISEFANFTAAMGVIQGYSFTFSKMPRNLRRTDETVLQEGRTP